MFTDEDRNESNNLAQVLIVLMIPLFVNKKINTILWSLFKAHIAIAISIPEVNEESLEGYIKMVEETFSSTIRKMYQEAKKEEENVH